MLIFSILFLLLSNAVTLRRDKSILFTRISIIILLYSALLANNSYHMGYIEESVGLYSGLLYMTNITQIFHIFIYLIGALILQLTAFYPRKVWSNKNSNINKLIFYNINYYKDKIINFKGEQFKLIEYPLIILFIISGSVFLISTSDLVSIFLSIELQSYGLYLLSTLYRNSELATWGGLTYFLLGGLSSCFILLGTALLYSNSGITNLDNLYIINDLTNALNINNALYYNSGNYINISLLVLSIGFLFKISAAPFHFWSPDVYDAIPTIVTTFVAIIAKISILVFLLEVVNNTSNLFFIKEFTWTYALLISSLLSLVIGTIVGLTQFRIKKLFAYSTISHLGFILLALTINTIESIQSFIFYLMQYSLSNLNAFLLLLSIGYCLYYYVNNNQEYEQLTDKNNSPIQFISQIKGFFQINPFLSISFAITIFSFVGIPPLIGFFAKQMVLSAALDNGYIFITLIAILTSVISAVYYLNMIKQVFFYKSDYVINPTLVNVYIPATLIINDNTVEKFTFTRKNIVLSNYLSISISVITLIILLFIFVPQEWLSMANILALTLNNT